MAGAKHEIEMKNLQSSNRHVKHIPKGNGRATGKKRSEYNLATSENPSGILLI